MLRELMSGTKNCGLFLQCHSPVIHSIVVKSYKPLKQHFIAVVYRHSYP